MFVPYLIIAHIGWQSCNCCWLLIQGNMDVSENSGTPKSSILIGCSIINHIFWGTPVFGSTHMIYSNIWYAYDIQSFLMKLLLSSGDSVSGVGGSAGVSWEWSCEQKKLGVQLRTSCPSSIGRWKLWNTTFEEWGMLVLEVGSSLAWSRLLMACWWPQHLEGTHVDYSPERPSGPIWLEFAGSIRAWQKLITPTNRYGRRS